MQKLTLAQAQLLLVAMDGLEIECPGGFADGFVACREDIRKIINQCTEKEFPDWKFTTADGMVFLKLEPSFVDDKFSSISLYFHNKEDSATEGLLYPDEFKEFTQRCQRICDWIQEQE